jgi:hypothetical protein
VCAIVITHSINDNPNTGTKTLNMKNKIKELALEAGGSTYPEVGGVILERFAHLMLEECIVAVQNTGEQCAYTTHDLSVVECTIARSVDALRNHFKD